MPDETKMTPGERLDKILAWCKAEAEKGNPEAILTLQQIPEVLARVEENRRLGRTPKLRGSS